MHNYCIFMRYSKGFACDGQNNCFDHCKPRNFFQNFNVFTYPPPMLLYRNLSRKLITARKTHLCSILYKYENSLCMKTKLLFLKYKKCLLTKLHHLISGNFFDKYSKLRSLRKLEVINFWKVFQLKKCKQSI